MFMCMFRRHGTLSPPGSTISTHCTTQRPHIVSAMRLVHFLDHRAMRCDVAAIAACTLMRMALDIAADLHM